MKKKVIFIFGLSILIFFFGCNKDESTQPTNSTPKSYTITLNKTGEGLVEIIPNKSIYEANEKVTLVATADSGWQFTNWVGSIFSDSNPYFFEIDNNLNITGVFEKIFVPDISGLWGGVQYVVDLDLSQANLTKSNFSGQAKVKLTDGSTLVYSVTGHNIPPSVEMYWNKSGYYQVKYSGVWHNDATIKGAMVEDGKSYKLDIVKLNSPAKIGLRENINIGKKIK